MKVSNSFVLNAAVAGLIAGSVSLAASQANAAGPKKVKCSNSCKGQHVCKGMKASAACGGHQHKMMSEEACTKAGGTVGDGKPAAAGEAAAPAPAAPAPGGEAPKTN